MGIAIALAFKASAKGRTDYSDPIGSLDGYETWLSPAAPFASFGAGYCLDILGQHANILLYLLGLTHKYDATA